MNRMIAMAALSKLAEDDGKGDTSWWERQKGVVRSSTDEGGKNWRGLIGIRSKDDAKRVRKATGSGAARGGLAGLAAGAALSTKHSRTPRGHKFSTNLYRIGAGGLVGAVLGGQHKQMREHQAINKERGVDVAYLGHKARFTPEARKKYIEDHRKS